MATEYKFTAWVHPKNGGDGYCISGKIVVDGANVDEGNDTAIVTRRIKAILKKEGSAVLDDYKITKEA